MTGADVLVLSAPLVCRQKPFPDAVQSLNVLSDIAEAGSRGGLHHGHHFVLLVPLLKLMHAG